MAKRHGAVGLPFLLTRFALVMLLSMALTCMLWFSALLNLQNRGIISRASEPQQQVKAMISASDGVFLAPDAGFLGEYALFDQNGGLLESNVDGKKLNRLKSALEAGENSDTCTIYSYADGSTAVYRYAYLADFRDAKLRAKLPQFEYLWLASLAIMLIGILVLNTLWLRRRLLSALKLFSQVSDKIAAQELDFEVPCAGIKEYDQALQAMDNMRVALKDALGEQWAAQQAREAEIAALAHDLKTPLTLIGGNAELLLEEDLPAGSRKMAETIIHSNERAREYLSVLLEGAKGEEPFKEIPLNELFAELINIAAPIAAARGVHLETESNLAGTTWVQKQRLLRALTNLVQNAVEYSPQGGHVYIQGSMTEDAWQITVRDEGPGFSDAALRHATERLWRGDPARAANGHHGLGLWFAQKTAAAHNGRLHLSNHPNGAQTTLKFPRKRT